MANLMQNKEADKSKTIFDYIEGLSETNFVNITGDTFTNFEDFKTEIITNRYNAFTKYELSIHCLGRDFLKGANCVQLTPFSEKPLNSQVYWLTGDFLNSTHEIKDNHMINTENGQKFVFASKYQEDRYKLIEKHRQELEKFDKENRYNDFDGFIIDFNNNERWKRGLKHAQETREVVEMCKEAYNHFLNCLPSKRFNGSMFLNSVPYTHNSKGEGVYIAGIEKNKRFFAQCGTVKQYDNGELFKKLLTI